MNLLVRISLGVSALFCIIVIVMMFAGYITFGMGLGDLAVVILLAALAIGIGGFYFAIRKQDFTKYKVATCIIVSICVLMVAYTVYEFTLGRDGEYRWNGCVFYMCQ